MYIQAFKKKQKTLYLPVLEQQVVAEAWMEVVAYPGDERDQSSKATVQKVYNSLEEQCYFRPECLRLPAES